MLKKYQAQSIKLGCHDVYDKRHFLFKCSFDVIEKTKTKAGELSYMVV